jgi:hypothetical protein
MKARGLFQSLTLDFASVNKGSTKIRSQFSYSYRAGRSAKYLYV